MDSLSFLKHLKSLPEGEAVSILEKLQPPDQEPTITFTLDGHIPSKKNSRQTNRATGRSFSSKKYQAWEPAQMVSLMVQGIPRKKIVKVEWISIHFYMETLRGYDISNQLESVMDMMVKYGLILDDNWKVIPRFRELTASHRKNNGGCVVQIREKKDDTRQQETINLDSKN